MGNYCWTFLATAPYTGKKNPQNSAPPSLNKEKSAPSCTEASTFLTQAQGPLKVEMGNIVLFPPLWVYVELKSHFTPAPNCMEHPSMDLERPKPVLKKEFECPVEAGKCWVASLAQHKGASLAEEAVDPWTRAEGKGPHCLPLTPFSSQNCLPVSCRSARIMPCSPNPPPCTPVPGKPCPLDHLSLSSRTHSTAWLHQGFLIWRMHLN